MRPAKIKRTGPRELTITWDDQHESVYTMELLRDNCPCASCAGETVLLRSYNPPPVDRTTPGRYELKGLQQVGSYAVQLEWGDGHSTGIYTWQHLLSICPCGKH